MRIEVARARVQSSSEAIEGPAARTGLRVEPGLVDQLVADVGGEAGALPLLSTTLLDLWLDREDDALTLAAYERWLRETS